MSAGWQVLGVRAHGLGTRLFSQRRLADLERTIDPVRLAEALDAAGRPAPAGATPIELDRAIARGVARGLEVLWRWAACTGVPTILVDDEDHRSLRALLRGAAQGASPEARLAGVIPTPTLPRRALEALATATTAREVAERVATSQHPVAPRLVEALAVTGPALLHLDVALARAFAERAHRLARRSPRHVRHWVASSIDLQNAWTVLLVDAATAERAGTDLFVPGGVSLPARRFAAAIRLPDEASRRSALADAFTGTALAEIFADPDVPLTQLEERVFERRLDEQRRAARRDPSGPAAVFLYLLRLRGEAARLRRLVWRAALGAVPDGVATVGTAG